MTILDSNIWIALFNVDDSNHQRAMEMIGQIDDTIGIPEYVIIEVGTVLLHKTDKSSTDRFIDHITSPSQLPNALHVLSLGMTFLKDVLRTFRQRENKNLSLVDTALLSLSTNNHILTFDKNLSKALQQSI